MPPKTDSYHVTREDVRLAMGGLISLLVAFAAYYVKRIDDRLDQLQGDVAELKAQQSLPHKTCDVRPQR